MNADTLHKQQLMASITSNLWSSDKHTVIERAMTRRFPNAHRTLLKIFHIEWRERYENDPSLSTKDCLFDLILLSLESMGTIKQKVKQVHHTATMDQKARFFKDWAKNIAEKALQLDAPHERFIKHIGLTIMLKDIFHLWLEDHDESMATTMQFIDKRLTMGQDMLNSPLQTMAELLKNKMGEATLNAL